MAAPKGNKFSPGRPKGSKDRKTLQWEMFSNWMMSEGLERFQEEMQKLNGKDYVMTVKDLMEYFQPKLSRVEGGNVGNVYTFNMICYDSNGNRRALQLPAQDLPNTIASGDGQRD